MKQLFNQKNKISFNNFNLKILNDNKLVLRIENIFFANFGYKKKFYRGKSIWKKI